MKIKNFLLATIATVSMINAQSSIGLNINDEDLEIFASLDINNYTNYSDGTSYVMDFSNLHTGDGDNLTSIGFSGSNKLQGAKNLSLAFGIKADFTDNFMALPLYGKATFRLPLVDTIPPTSLSASIAYAPKVLTFNDGKNYTAFRTELSMQAVPNIHVILGYRNIDTNYEEFNKSFNSTLYGGMKLTF